jgi:hypothetical protein
MIEAALSSNGKHKGWGCLMFFNFDMKNDGNMVAHALACKALAMGLMKVKFKILISCTKFLVGFFLFLLSLSLSLSLSLYIYIYIYIYIFYFFS